MAGNNRYSREVAAGRLDVRLRQLKGRIHPGLVAEIVRVLDRVRGVRGGLARLRQAEGHECLPLLIKVSSQLVKSFRMTLSGEEAGLRLDIWRELTSNLQLRVMNSAWLKSLLGRLTVLVNSPWHVMKQASKVRSARICGSLWSG